MNFTKVLFNRHSTRSFQNKPVEREKIERLLEAGTYAPNGNHENTWQFTVLQNKEKIQDLAKRIGETLHINEHYTMYFPNAIIFVSDRKDNPNLFANCACALQNIFLQAEHEGLGSVWINQLRTICDEPNIRQILNEFGIPEDHIVGGIAAIGYEKEKRPRAKKFANIHWV